MSKYTAISRKSPSVPARWLESQGLLLGEKLDFGCGRGQDAVSYNMKSYDPSWAPEMPGGLFNTITCTYVLNVLGPEEISSVLEQVKSKLLAGGKAYFTVRRDIGGGKRAGKGCIQCTVSLFAPYVSIKKTGSYEIYEYTS